MPVLPGWCCARGDESVLAVVVGVDVVHVAAGRIVSLCLPGVDESIGDDMTDMVVPRSTCHCAPVAFCGDKPRNRPRRDHKFSESTSHWSSNCSFSVWSALRVAACSAMP